METIKELEELLSEVTTISKKYDEIAKTSGENFNIFSIMSMESKERYTHSAIIGELLNPKGSHGQGSVFLKLFIDEIEPLKKWNDFEYESAVVILEEHLGKIDEEYSRGGFIDIVIRSRNKTIIIENKIYAPEQRNQLQRYKYHYRECECVLLYLNLSGISPSVYSTGHLILHEDFHIISYKNEILNWLEKCIVKANNLLIIRETIRQYIYLIKKLTNQTTNNKMSEEVIDLLKKNIKGSFIIQQNYDKLKLRGYYDFIELIIKYGESNGMEVNKDKIYEESEYGITLIPNNWKDKRLEIFVSFENPKYNNLYYGISYKDNLEKHMKLKISSEFEKNEFKNADIYLWKYPKTYIWEDNFEVWEDIFKGINGTCYNEIIQGINTIIEIEKRIE